MLALEIELWLSNQRPCCLECGEPIRLHRDGKRDPIQVHRLWCQSGQIPNAALVYKPR